jgi:hypothetical protein
MNPYAALPTLFWIAYGTTCALLWVLILVSMWKIYVKMGMPGWKCLVPFYSLWVLIERLRKPQSWFWILMLGWLIYIVGYSIFLWFTISGAVNDNPIIMLPLLLLIFAGVIVLLVYAIRLTHALSKAFGHDAGYTVGLLFLPFVFYPILAFGPDRFQLPE